MSLPILKEWVEYVKVVGDADGVPRGIKAEGAERKLLARLSVRHVRSLVSKYIGSRSARNRRAAFWVLSAMLRMNDERLGPAQRHRWSVALSRRVRTKYPDDVGFHQWAALAPEEARDFLVHFNPSRLVEAQARRYIEHLTTSRVTGPATFDRLNEIASGRNRAAVAARAALTKINPPNEATVAAKGREWRRRRGVRELSWLYYNYISRVLDGDAISPILTILGKADHIEKSARGCEYIWKPRDTTDGGWLRLFADVEGGVHESGLK